jgi:hypothetical protein
VTSHHPCIAPSKHYSVQHQSVSYCDLFLSSQSRSNDRSFFKILSFDIAFLDLPLTSKKANVIVSPVWNGHRRQIGAHQTDSMIGIYLQSPEGRICLLSDSIRHSDKTLVNVSITSSQISALTRCPLLSLSSEPKPKWPVLENQNAGILMSSLWTISATGSPSLRVVYIINPYLLYRSLGSEKHVIG